MQWKLATAGLVLSLGCAAALVVGEIQAVAAQHEHEGAELHQELHQMFLQELPTSPANVTQGLVVLIGQGTPAAAQAACTLFSLTAAAQLAAANHTATCAQAITRLQRQVIDGREYINDLTVPDDQWTDGLTRADMDECAVTWTGQFTGTPDTVDPGPKPGRMTMERQEGYGWLITQYQPC